LLADVLAANPCFEPFQNSREACREARIEPYRCAPMAGGRETHNIRLALTTRYGQQRRPVQVRQRRPEG